MGAAPAPGARLIPRAYRAAAAAALAAGLVLARPLAAQDTHLLLVVGLAGDSTYAARFRGWANTIYDAAVTQLGVRAADVVWLDDSAGPHVKDRATLATVRAAITGIAQRAGPDDRLLVVLIGHGTEREDKSLFNLTGPDLTPADLGLMLDQLAPRRVGVVNTASASGGFVEGLKGPGRTVITATRSGRENNETWFAQFFADALAKGGADLDKDGRVSLFEAFEYARREVKRYYDEKKILVTEHALLDGDGNGIASMEPNPEDVEGLAAGTFYVGSGARGRPGEGAAAAAAAPTVHTDDPVLKGLLAERMKLEERIAELRSKKAQMEAAAYEQQLEDLLVELALKDREIKAKGGGK